MREAKIRLRKYRGFWMDWFGLLGREISCSRSWFTDNPYVFLSTVEDCVLTRKDCLMSVQPFRGRGLVFGLEKVFFKFDFNMKNPKPKDSFEEVRCLVEQLRERLDLEPLIIRSGSSFHVYIFLRNIVEFDFGKENTHKLLYWLLQEEMLENVPHSTLNRECLGDLNQLEGVPYSTHESGANYLPVDFRGRPIQIDDLGVYREGGINQGVFRKFVRKCSEDLGNVSPLYAQHSYTDDITSKDFSLSMGAI